jgi:hypothetical protein
MAFSREIWTLLAILIGYAFISRLRTWFRLRHIPGPAFAGFSKVWLLRKAIGGRFHLDTAEVCEKYGSGLLLLARKDFAKVDCRFTRATRPK